MGNGGQSVSSNKALYDEVERHLRYETENTSIVMLEVSSPRFHEVMCLHVARVVKRSFFSTSSSCHLIHSPSPVPLSQTLSSIFPASHEPYAPCPKMRLYKRRAI